MSRDGDFLSRWARRKAEAREAEIGETEKTAAISPDTDARDAASATEDADNQDRPATEEEIAALPDPDSLEHGADFKPFLRPGIPAALRQRALRRLWRVNPAIGFLDGMNEYDLDYTDAATVVENLKTAYDAVKGYAFPEDEAEEASAKATAEAAEQDAPSAADDGPLSEAATDDDPVAETPTPERKSDDIDDVLRERAVEHAEDEVLHSHGGKAGGNAAATAAGSESPSQAPVPGQAAARRWARFSTSIER